MIELPVKNDILYVKVTPNSSSTRVLKIDGDVAYICVAAAPDKDKANKTLLSFLSKKYGMNAVVERGRKGRNKKLLITRKKSERSS